MKKVLLLSAGSPCRAIMAEYILKKYMPDDLGIFFVSAGIEVNNEINPSVIKILTEEGIDVSKLTSRVLEDVEDFDFDLVFTMCSHSNEKCPNFPKIVPTVHMEFSLIDNEDEATCRALAKRIRIKLKPIILKSIQ